MSRPGEVKTGGRSGGVVGAVVGVLVTTVVGLMLITVVSSARDVDTGGKLMVSVAEICGDCISMSVDRTIGNGVLVGCWLMTGDVSVACVLLVTSLVEIGLVARSGMDVVSWATTVVV